MCLFDDEKVVEKTSVLIENGNLTKIASVIKGKYLIIDRTGKTKIPELINDHMHR